MVIRMLLRVRTEQHSLRFLRAGVWVATLFLSEQAIGVWETGIGWWRLVDLEASVLLVCIYNGPDS
jgi:hypothetical protein